MTTVEPQYESHLRLKERKGLTKLGVEKNANWQSDPKRLVFVLSRYKFVSKMLAGKKRVLEIGCGDCWPIRILLQEVEYVHGIDIDPAFIQDANERMDEDWPFSCEVHDMLDGPLSQEFDAAYSLDVLEHISLNDEDKFMRNAVDSLSDKGVLIIGMPSLESQEHASPLSKVGHINCKMGPELKIFLQKYFHNVFIFSMNDEVIHTGFTPMSQYLMAICTEKRLGK